MIERKLESELEAHLGAKEISLIVGPRQAGKTTLMKFLEGKLKVRGERTVFFNLDIEGDRRHFSSQEEFLEKVRLEIGNQKGYVFIDEIQRKENAGLFLKGLYDRGLPYKFVVSGSGSLELKEKIKESLVGRKRIFELDTITFEEFVNFKTDYKYRDKLDDFFKVERNKTMYLLKEYLSYGGYPRIVLSETHNEKLSVIEEIFSSYIDKDIKEFIRSRRVNVYADLVRLMSVRLGSLTNLSELSSILGVSLPTLKSYLWYAEKTFIIRKVSPFYKNRTKELTRSPIYYFVDIGLRNFGTGKFGRLIHPEDLAMPFQNLVFNILREKIKRSGAQIHFWRTKDGAEVDFVLLTGEGVVPVEVKVQEFKKPKVTRSLRIFIKKYNPSRALVVSLTSIKPITVHNTQVFFISVFDLLGFSPDQLLYG